MVNAGGVVAIGTFIVSIELRALAVVVEASREPLEANDDIARVLYLVCSCRRDSLIHLSCRMTTGFRWNCRIRRQTHRCRQSYHLSRHYCPSYPGNRHFRRSHRCLASHCLIANCHYQLPPDKLPLGCDPLPDGPLREPDSDPDEPLAKELLSPDNELPEERDCWITTNWTIPTRSPTKTTCWSRSHS